MNLNPLRANRNEIVMGDLTVFFSYRTPVAAHVAGVGYMKTDKRWSVTTSKHINQWLTSNGASMDKVKVVPQSQIDALASGKAV